MVSDHTTDDQILVSAEEVARLLDMSVRNVRRLDATARLPAPIRIGRSVKWRREEIAQWCEAGCPTRERWEAMQGTGDPR